MKLNDILTNFWSSIKTYLSNNYLGKTSKAESSKSADSVAWNNVSGKPSTYTPSSHTHDDRYYTESEVNTKLSGKSDTSHNHDSVYLGINGKSSSSASADKLSTTRSINIGNYDFQGSANFDGSANITLNATPYNCKFTQGNRNNYPYHYIGTTNLVDGIYQDRSITLLITRDYNGGGYGIINIILRTNDSGVDSVCEAKWLVRSDLPEDSIQLGLIKTSGKSYLDIYYKTTSTYQSCTFRCLGAGTRGSIIRAFALVNSSEANNTTTTDAKTSVGSYTTVNNGGSAIRGSVYSSVVLATDNGNVNYSKKATNNANGKELVDTIVKGISISGKTITVTKLDGSTYTLTTQDTNTTYSKLSQFTNDSGYITSSGSCNYATSAGSAPANGGTSTASGYLNGYETLQYGVNRLQYFNTNTSTTSGAGNIANPTADWYHHIIQSHANSKGYYFDIASGFHSNSVYYRRIAGGAESGWIQFIDSGNIGSQSVNYATYSSRSANNGSFYISGYQIYVG